MLRVEAVAIISPPELGAIATERAVRSLMKARLHRPMRLSSKSPSFRHYFIQTKTNAVQN